MQQDNFSIEEVITLITKDSNSVRAMHHLRFFKTGKGEYGDGDCFLGLTNPQCHDFAKQFKNITLEQTELLLQNKYHEIRLIALFILVRKYKTKDINLKVQIYSLYLKNTKHINNWDLVDLSASKILGTHLLDKKRDILTTLANSKNLWEERIAIIATHTFIKNKDYTPTLNLAKQFLTHKHDLIHKACGWMLREVGKQDKPVLSAFLTEHKNNMPRTMLRYAIEHYTPEERKTWLATH